MRTSPRSAGRGGPKRWATRMTLVAMLGGYLNRRNDPPPGHQIQWDGQIRLAQRAQLVEDMQALGWDSGVLKLVCPDKI